ncbi:MAG: right-handed parallel beta-helix repeat-containing protein [Prevotella sp.]|nr:right-handed parallel beta-helix repeat-containing protein [Prevotella sp.]
MHKTPTLLAALLMATLLHAGDIVVTPDDNLHDALRQAREWRRTNDPRCDGGITIHLKGGHHQLSEPLFIRPEDSGTEASPTIIRGEDGATICGDPPRQHTQLFPKEGMERLLGFDPARRTITIPTPPRDVLKRHDVEMVVHQRWAIAILRVKAFHVEGERTIVTFKEPESRLEFEHPWPQPIIDGERGSSSFLLRTTEQRRGVEQLVIVAGAECTPVRHVTFENITFSDACWNRPIDKGHVTLQGGFPIIDAYKLQKEGLPWAATLENQAWVERPVAAVSVTWSEHVDFRGCTFTHLASTALDYTIGISDCTIENNTFNYIGGTAIMAGSFAESPREVHRPYTDLARLCQRLVIRGNHISNASCEDWGAVGIGCGYVRETTIDGNEVSDVNYSGICVGWGWTPLYTGMENNRITRNRVERYAQQLYDAGGIYTLSNQPGSLIKDNIISPPSPAPYATNDRGFHIYLDAETDGYTIEGNTCEGRPIGKEQTGFNHPGPQVIFK